MMSAAREVFIAVAYLLAAVAFIISLKRLGSPATARSGNAIGAIGMLLAIVATLLHQDILTFTWILAGMLIGGAAGAISARLIKMTAMPQMVGVLNGFGGGASMLVAVVEYMRLSGNPTPDVATTIVLGVLIGGVTFSGSMVAAGKLQELIASRALVFPFQKTINALLFLMLVALGWYVIVAPTSMTPMWTFVGLALVLGVLLVIPIGGADMPVVVSLMNSYSGIAGAATGFVLHNNALIISGALVGASGIILTQIMCRAMNRSLANVMFGAFGAQQAGTAGTTEARPVRQLSPEDAAVALGYARSVIFVPGYGMAVSQAQHQVRELADLLIQRGAEVKYAIHPVAGRMPGHMNVLLAEANVPYPQLFEMEQINPEFDRADVAVVIGANDVVNPAARHDNRSPIYGMPILDVDKAKSVIVMKRSMAAGFAGIENELFYQDNTRMLFGDARKTLTALIGELKRGI